MGGAVVEPKEVEGTNGPILRFDAGYEGSGVAIYHTPDTTVACIDRNADPDITQRTVEAVQNTKANER